MTPNNSLNQQLKLQLNDTLLVMMMKDIKKQMHE